MEKKKKIIPIFAILIVWMIITQLGTFAFRLAEVLPNRPYKHAKVYMSAALIFNFYYAYPLQSAFGIDAPIAKPAIWIREKLYQKGVSLLPEDDAEKELWWARIQGPDYFSLLYKEYVKYVNGKPPKKYPPDFMLKKYDEFYPHIIALATLPVGDKGWKDEGERLVTVNNFASTYTKGKWAMCWNKYSVDECFADAKHNIFIQNKEEMQKIRNIFKVYMGLANSFPEGEYARLNPEYPDNEPIITLEMSSLIVGEDIFRNNFSCKSPDTKYFLDSYNTIYKRYNDTNLSYRQTGMKNHKSLLTDYPIIDEILNKISKDCSIKVNRVTE